MRTDTIAAIATALSNSGIGIVRISGDQAAVIIDKLYKGKKNKKISGCNSHTIHYGYIMDGEETIDEALVMYMKGPRTYTGEDTVEINCHGGSYVVKRVLETVIKYGARPAEPGEFTKRAFLHGKMDLSQAEAVGDIISSQNQYALKNSVNQLKGKVKTQINEIRNKIIYHTAFIESALDDPEHISVEGYGVKLEIEIDDMLTEIDKLLATVENGRMIREGIQTVIVGKPNAGKSSLLNIMSGKDKAIVTEIAGTTRDILEEYINIDGLNLNVIDTAGIHDTDDIVEKIGVDKAAGYVEKADLILYVVDSSVPLNDNDKKIIDMIKEKKVIVLLNKSDLNKKINKENFKFLIDVPVVEISAKQGFGIDQLELTIKELFFDGDISFNDEVYITNIRQKNCLSEAVESLKKVKESIVNGMPEDFYSIDLMDAYNALGNITGETMGEDLVNEIFSKFCMGK